MLNECKQSKYITILALKLMSDYLIIKRRRGNTIDAQNYNITLNLSENNSTLLSLKQEISKISIIFRIFH